MKFIAPGVKKSDAPHITTDSSGTMKFPAGGIQNSAATGSKTENSTTMRFSAGGAKNANQVRPAYSLPSNLKTGKGNNTVIPKTNADSILHQVNASRTNMQGVNAKRLPSGQVLVHKDGGLIIKASGGRNYNVRTNGTIASYSERGRTAEFRPNGNLRSLRAGGMEINRGQHNERSIVTHRADKSVLVSTGPQMGYLQRAVVRNNKTFIHRTYVENNSTYTRAYRSHTYNGITMQSYVPEVHYEPAFYGWAYDPWRTPVNYSWRWQRDPWHEFYSGYFTPLSVYPNSASWLTDHLLAESLRTAYLARNEENVGEQQALYAQTDTPVSHGVREMIARGIKQQLAQEREAAKHPEQAANYGKLSTAMRDPNHLFVVSGNLDVAAGDQMCGLTAGDILQLNSTPPKDVKTADLLVISSKRDNCPTRSVVTVGLNDLQEMHNNMRERIYDGLDILRQNNGSDGIPAAPKVAMSPPRKTEVASLGSSGDNVLAMLRVQQEDADQAEQQVIQSAFTEELAMNHRWD
jgi:hypothetical protein